ncbi:MAG: right-handed parallel beta-helix repeat-containing protein [Nitrospirota bacterium]|nr:right-handed parallel beta-helix repeat-containing protein [Nitrospirota bacterium]MDH5773561.1 right-handed parallel beta-helix repeat-containing protein [Nitrospirota bacterium]
MNTNQPPATGYNFLSTQATPLTEPPPNPLGGRTLIVDSNKSDCFTLPSEALNQADAKDQIFLQPGIYEDRLVISERPIYLIGAGRDQVTIFSRRSGPCYLQRVSGGQISGITFRYVGSDQHSALNILDSTCTISRCRVTEGLLSGVVIYGPDCRPTLQGNEICYNRESGLFAFAGAQPYLRENDCFGNHHFGIAARDQGTRPDIIQNVCRDNMLSGLLLFSQAHALILDNRFEKNAHWGAVLTPDSEPSPLAEELSQSNTFTDNPRGNFTITSEPLADIGR